MDTNTGSAVHSVLAILAVFLISRALWHLVWRPYMVARLFERQGIRGPPYRLVFGSKLEMRGILAAGRAKGPNDTRCHDQMILKSVLAMTMEGAQKMMEQWCSQIERANGRQVEIDMRCYSEELTLGVIEQVILGQNCKLAREVFVAGKELQKLAVYAFSDPPVPGYRYMPTRGNLRAWKLDRLIVRNVTQFTKARIACGVHGDDLLGRMLDAGRSEGEAMSTDEILGELKTFFATGQDTSDSLLTWVMFLLSSYPEWQEKLREEIRTECRDVHIVDVVGKLKLLNMFLLETLRLYSPVPIYMRKAASDTILANIKVPKGTIITFPVLMLHRSKHIWGLDADDFNPMRFEKGASRAGKYGHSMLAFSYGARGCTGRNYAMIQVQTVIVTILRRFSFTLSSQYVHKPTYFITLVPRYGLPLIVKELHEGENK